jgi:uncharacterized protein (DUF488 family)
MELSCGILTKQLFSEVMPQKNRLSLPSTSPKKQLENRLLWNDGRDRESADFFTVGYTGRPLGELLDALVLNNVRTLVDIRANPVSMYRPEVSKSNLARAVEERGLGYLHIPDLGVPRDIRARAIEAGTRDAIWGWYDEYVVQPYISGNLHKFLNMAEHPVALMCVEIDPKECHRHRLFQALEEQGLVGFEL